MIDPIEALADCIMTFEGWRKPETNYHGSTSWRNRNPGNLRDGQRKVKLDDRGYAIYKSLSDGWMDLLHDLAVKLSGQSSHNLTGQSTLHELFNVYAPALDQNDPTQYSRMIALWLSRIYNCQVTPETKLSDILNLGKTQI